MAFGINNLNQVVGTFWDSSPYDHSYVKTGDAFTTFDVPGVGEFGYTHTTGINDTGVIVGSFNVDSNTFAFARGFVKTGSTFTTIDVPGALATEAIGINNANQIVGRFFNSDRIMHGFVKTGATFTIIDVPGALNEPGWGTLTYGINDAGVVVGAFVDPTIHQLRGFIATPNPTPFAALTASLELKFAPRIDDTFDLQSNFTLSTASDGIDPLTEDVTLELTGETGSFTTTIPADSFTRDKKGRFEFKGEVDGVKLDATLTPLGSQQYAFTAAGKQADLSGIANPVTVTLTIGDDRGSITVTATVRGQGGSSAAR
jgi:hypothetical protein